MTDHDHVAARREITSALLAAFERRHEVLDVIVEAETRPDAVEAIATLLGTSRLGGEAVMGMSFASLTKETLSVEQAKRVLGDILTERRPRPITPDPL